MLQALSNVVNEIALGPQNRKVRNYLDGVTYDSVLEEVEELLSSQATRSQERNLLQTTFDRHCITDSALQKYWTEESFRDHIRTTHTSNTVSDPAIQLLWRSFHFYAFHPFPSDLQDANVDFHAFKRAALLLVFKCNELLGTRELEWYWRNDETVFRKAKLARIFRSFEVPVTPHKNKESAQPSDMVSIVNDAMDVLVMIGPQFMHAMPSPEQLESVARKLLPKAPTIMDRGCRRSDLSTFMSLLQRLRIKEEKWGSSWSFGDLEEEDPANLKNTEESMSNFIEANDRSEVFKAADLVERNLRIPDLEQRFYQLWAVLFQPSNSAKTVNQEGHERRSTPEGSMAAIKEVDLKNRIQGFGSL